MVLPLSVQDRQMPLIVDDREISLIAPWEIVFLFLLGLSARGETSLRLPDDIERRHWGWLFLRNTDMRLRVQKLELRVREIGNFSPLRLEGSLCRLRAEGGNVFFSPDLFSAELRQGELFLRRGALDDFVRSCGLQRLYEPEDGSVSKELQRFRFAIQVR